MSQLSVATWNVHHRRHNAAIAADIDKVLAEGVELLGLNEVGGHQSAVGTARQDIGHVQPSGAKGAPSSALLWRTDVLQLMRHGRLQATKAVYVGPRGAGPAHMHAKFVTWAQFLHLESNRRVFALVSHFPATIERAGKPNIALRKRMQVTRAMWATNAVLVSRFAPRGQVLVLGDMNWDARTDEGTYADAPRAAADSMGLQTSYETLGLPSAGTKGGRLIDYVLYPRDRSNAIEAVAQRIFDVNTDNDHRVLAVDMSLTAR
jgi:hypothetical protein